MSCMEVLSSINNDGFDNNELDISLSHVEENLLQYLKMNPRPKDPVKTTPRKGKAKFVFHPPPEAPVFKPTIEEFENPLHYINSIKPLAEKCGICKIIPPAGWKSPFVLDMDKLKFTPRIQRINELEARTRIKLNFIDNLTKFFASTGKTFQIPLIEKTPLDLYTLHKAVRDMGGMENVTKERNWNEIATRMGFSGKGAPTSLKLHYEHLINPYILSKQEKKSDSSLTAMNPNHSYFDEKMVTNAEEDENNSGITNQLNSQMCHVNDEAKGTAFRELKSLKFLGPGPKMAVFDGPVKTMKTRTRGKKILYEFDPLAKYMCKSCSNGDIEESLVTCFSCEDRYHSSCLFPPLVEKPIGDWKCPKCVAIEVCKPLEEFGFAQAEREYTLIEFKQMADEFKQNYFKMIPNQVPTQKVEDEFWRVVSSIEEAVTVEYGADLHVADHGSGFPVNGKSGNVCTIDNETFSKYAESSWNLNNLPVLKASVLRHISANISGMKIPWMYAGMCFATFCWHNEDHWSYSINYLHLGEPKTWYGVSGSMAEEFEEAMKAAAPELFETQPDILHQLVTIMNPNDIMAAGVPVYRTDQKEGEFVITFPRAYHAGFNQGFNFAEACNFAPYDWLAMGRECISHYSSLGRPCVFSHDELVCKMALMADELDGNIAWATINDGKAMLNAERIRRHIITKQGVYKAVKTKFEELPDDERQCAICNTTCFLSGVTCPCDETRLVCLEHVSDLCGCPYSVYVMKYEYQIDEIANMLMVLENKTLKFNTWLARVEEALSSCKKPKISLRELTELLIEANDKEFPRNDLIAILHYQVSKCIEVSALARTILSNAKKKSEVKRITIEELAMFSKEIDNLPCILMEANAIKQLLSRAKNIQRFSSKSLSLKNIKKCKLINYINWMESTNLEFKELPLMRKRLKERQWLEETDDVLAHPGSVDLKTLERLIAAASEIPISKTFKNKKDALTKQKNATTEKWRKSISAATWEEVKIDEQNTNASFFQLTKIPTPSSSHNTSQLELLAKEWQKKTLSVLFGESVLNVTDLEILLSQGQAFPFKVDGVDELEENLKNVQNWKSTLSKAVLKKKTTCSLLQALWPRRFVSRENVNKRKGIVQLESMIHEGERNFTRAHYKSASSNQTRSLFKLRLDNLAKRANAGFLEIKCVCGSYIAGEVVVCELCQTAFHGTCFRGNDKVVNNFVYGFRLKVMCSYCTRTKRPSLTELSDLLTSAESLKIKIPEYYVLRFFIGKVRKWQREARLALSTQEMITALDALLAAMQNKCALERTNKGNQNIISRSLENLHLLQSCSVEDFRNISSPVEISREALINLRQILIIGDSYEVTTMEASQLWILIDSSRSDLLLNEDPRTLKNLIHVVDNIDIKFKFDRVKKLPLKQKQKTKNALSLPKAKIKKQIQAILPQSVTPIKRAPKRKNTIKKGLSLASKFFNMAVEEHEPGDKCAAGVDCSLPVDESVDWVQCDGKCGKWFHMKCVDLTNQDVTEDDEFICLPCLGGFNRNEILPKPQEPESSFKEAIPLL